VLAEWAVPVPAHLPPSLHIYCNLCVSLLVVGALLGVRWPPAPPSMRALIFRLHVPLVLAYAERQLLASRPALAAAPVYLHLRTPESEHVLRWGRFGDPASWIPSDMVQ